MRLYRLLARVGRVKKRMYPWFEALPAGAPMKYDGWRWDPAIAEWVEDDVAEITIEVEVPKYPKPALEPRPELPAQVPGWQWSDSMQEWFEIRFAGGHYEQQPRPPMPEWIPKETEKYYAEGWYWSVRKPGWAKDWSWVPDMTWIPEPRPPMPKYVPGPAVPPDVEGWSWSEANKEWVATIVVGEPIGFTPPRSLPPWVTEEAIFELYSWEQLYLEEVRFFVSQGYTLEAAKNITRDNFDNLLRMIRAQSTSGAKDGWQGMVSAMSGQDLIVIKEITVMALLALAAAAVGYLIGTILDRLVTPAEDYVHLTGGVTTFLLGPDIWVYSRRIGTSPTGREYYSECDDIGAEYSRHKRGYGIGQGDIIDFPGGFVEMGFKFPYFVKYTWEYWELVYVGMLASSGPDFYVLKVGKYFTGEVVGPASMVPADEWCPNFRFYL